METRYINNLISLVATSVDMVHRDPRFDLDVVKEHLKNTNLYGHIDGNVIMHIAAVLGSIKRQKDQDDLDDYYSDFNLQ
jgi:hypothetical protein